jgi:hypothetical protein
VFFVRFVVKALLLFGAGLPHYVWAVALRVALGGLSNP